MTERIVVLKTGVDKKETAKMFCCHGSLVPLVGA